MAMSFQSDLRKMQVVGASGRVLGEIEDVEIDVATWRIATLVVVVNSSAVADLGVDKPFWSHARIHIPIHQVSGATETVVLRSTVEELAQLISMAKAEATDNSRVS